MSVVKSLLLGLGGAAVVASGVAGTASTASAHEVRAALGACETYAREYAAVNAPRFGLAGWNDAYRVAYNDCITDGPTFATDYTYGDYAYGSPYYGLGTALTAPVVAGANVAGAAVNAGASIAGAALSIPGAILGGTAAALTPSVTYDPEPVISPTAEPVVVKNYRGTYETAPVAGVAIESTSALAVPTPGLDPFTPEWIAYCEGKYNSFNPDTGMYLAYSGTYRMCN